MNEDKTVTETVSTETTTALPESQLRMFGASVSFRGILALVLVCTLSYLTIQQPDLFAKTFESIVIAVVAFYFGQSKK